MNFGFPKHHGCIRKHPSFFCLFATQGIRRRFRFSCEVCVIVTTCTGRDNSVVDDDVYEVETDFAGGFEVKGR